MAKRKTIKPIPRFASEAEEREFWETHDTTPYVDWSLARRAVFPNLKPTTTTISLRLPTFLLADLKVLANRQDVPYQSLLKVFLTERVAAETSGAGRALAKSGAPRPKRRAAPARKK
jgi:predicted DNA binding CopG/RHH family protein